MRKVPTPDPVAEARDVIEQDKRRRAGACEAAISAVLKKHGCVLVPWANLRGGQVESGVVVVALDKGE